MKQKALWILPLLGVAVSATACGSRYDDRDRAVAPVPRETAVTATDNLNHPGRTAGDVVSDVVDDGVDIVSDVVDGGREIAGDVNSAIDDMARREPNSETDKNDNYYAGTDGRTDTQTTTRR